jgi:hypothetical protein
MTVEGAHTKLERRQLAQLCALLPELRERAEQGLWSDELDELIGELQAGGSAVQACERLGLAVAEPDTLRGEQPPGVEGAQLEGLAEVRLDGDYRCPSARCARRGRRDDRGRAPVCAFDGRPMLFRSGG